MEESLFNVLASWLLCQITIFLLKVCPFVGSMVCFSTIISKWTCNTDAQHSLFVPGSPGNLVDTITSCPFYFSRLHLTYDMGNGVQCQDDKDSTGHVSGGRLTLQSCQGDGYSDGMD